MRSIHSSPHYAGSSSLERLPLSARPDRLLRSGPVPLCRRAFPVGGRAHTQNGFGVRGDSEPSALFFFLFTRSQSKTADATVLSQRQKPRRMMEYWRQCALWLINCKVLPANHRVTWESAQVFDLAQTLRDGVLLCHLLNNLRPQTINLKEINLRPQMSQVRSERASANKQTQLRRRERHQTS